MTYGPLAGKMTTFTYDCRNRLVSAGGTRYIYDAENNRIGVETSEKKTTYVINTQPELSQVLQSTETNLKDNKETTTYYYYGNGLNAQDNGESYFVYHFNNVGSTMAVTDAKGSIVETYNYTSYGELIDGEYREDIPFLYNGQYGVTTDSNGLYYMRARYYNVEIKRFINQDVLLGLLERVSSLNRYAYVEGNPISYLDPFGLAIEVMQGIVDIAKTALSITSVVAYLIPGVGTELILMLNAIIVIADVILDFIQLMRYQTGDRADELLYDSIFGMLGMILPIMKESEHFFISFIGKKASNPITDSINALYNLIHLKKR